MRHNVPPIPPDSKFFHEIESTDGSVAFIFSPYEEHKKMSSWSHDADLPWFLTHTDDEFLAAPEEWIIICTMAWAEWSRLRDHPDTPRRIDIDNPYDRLVCEEAGKAWLEILNKILEEEKTNV